MRLGAAAPRSERSAPEQNTVPDPVSTTARTSGSLVASRNARVQLLEQAGGQGVAVVRRIQRHGADAVAVLHADQRIRHGWRSVGVCPPQGPKLAGGIVRR